MKLKAPLTAVTALLMLSACSTSDEAPEPATGIALQNECIKIPDRNERERCIDEAAFGRRP